MVPLTPGEATPRARSPSIETCMPDCRPNDAMASVRDWAGMLNVA